MVKIKDFRPNLLPSIRDAHIRAKRSVLSSTMSGEWISRKRGHGIEFAGYRQYTSGDDASQIDWKASVRSRKLLVKELQEERDLNIFFLLDVSDTMLFGTTDKLKAEYAAELLSSLAFAAAHSGESTSFSLFNDRITHHLPLSIGLSRHALALRLLSNPENYGGKRDFAKVGRELLAIMRTRGLIIIISDFIGFDKDWDRTLKIMAEAHDLLCILVRDQRDRRLPASGEYVLADPSSGEVIVIDVADYAEPYKAYVEAEEARLKTLLRRANADLVSLETTEDFSRVLMRYFMLRSQRLES